MKSLCWLRGWVSKAAVAVEFQELHRCNERSKSCANCIERTVKCSHPSPTIYEKLCEMRKSKTMKPLFVTMSMFFIAAFSGVTGMGPFIVQILKAYDSPLAPDRTATLVSVANNLGMFALLVFIRITGKRPLYLTMLSCVLLSAAVVCAYGFIWLPNGYNSFDQSNYVSMDNESLAYIPFVGILLWHGFTCCGIYSLPWQWLSEAFPYR